MKRKYSTGKSVIEFKPPRVFKKSKTSMSSKDHNLLMKLKKNMLSHEKKFLDTSISSGYSTAGTGTVTLINGLVQGTDENTRIGRQITISSIFVRGVVLVASTTTGTGAIRTILVLDQEVPQVAGVGQAMTITDYLVSDSLDALNNLNNRKRFKVLMSEVQNLSSYAAGGGPSSAHIDFYKKVNIPVEFNAADNGNIGDFTKNALYLITYQYGLATTAPTMQVNTRIRFTDN